jgi:hypothetical protein
MHSLLADNDLSDIDEDEFPEEESLDEISRQLEIPLANYAGHQESLHGLRIG